MSQVPDVNSSFYLETGVQVGGAFTTPSAVQPATVDTLSSTTSTSTTPVLSAVQYQKLVQNALDAFLSSLLSANSGNINIVSSVLNNALGSAIVPNQTGITNQYNADTVLTNAAASLIGSYDSYISGQTTVLANTLSTASTPLQSAQTTISGVITQISAKLSAYNTDFAAGNYTAALADITDAITLYNNNIPSTYTSVTQGVSSYNTSLTNYYSANGLSPAFTQSAWDAAQAAITARNNNTSITEFFSTLTNLPNFPTGTSPLASTISLTSTTPPASSTFGFPASVTSSTSDSAVTNSFNQMIAAAQAAEQAATDAVNASAVNQSSIATAPALIATPAMPSYNTYFQTVTSQLAIFLTNSSLQELLLVLGIQNNASAQALTTLLLTQSKGAPTVLLTNPSGGAVTGATLNLSANSQFVQAYQAAFARELLREVQAGEVFQTSTSIKSGTTAPSDLNVLPAAATGSATALTNAPADPGTSTGVGMANNIPILTSDFAALLGQFSVLAAIQVLQSDSTVSSQDTQTVQTEFLAAVSQFISQFSISDLDSRITALLQSQGQTISQQNLDAINQIATQFLTALQGILTNNISGQVNLATSTIGAQIASDYVQSTFQVGAQTQQRQQEQQQAQQQSDQQLQDLLANLPQGAYLSGPAGLAQQAISGGGGGQNGTLGLALAGILPKDSNGNFLPVTPTQLYNDLVTIQGQQTGSATFLQFVQNEPSYQLEEVTSSNMNRGHAGQLSQKLQVNQQSTLAANANKAFADSLQSNNAQLKNLSANYQQLSDLINNPTLSQYYSNKLLPGQNLLNTGLQVRKDQFVTTPVSRNTTDFAI